MLHTSKVQVDVESYCYHDCDPSRFRVGMLHRMVTVDNNAIDCKYNDAKLE